MQSRARFNEIPKKLRKALVESESRARFNEVPEKVLEKVLEGLSAAKFNEALSRFRRDSWSVSA